MVQIIPREPSFGESFGAALGGGVGQGISRGTEFGLRLSERKSLAKEDQAKKDKMVGLLVERGVDPQDAKLYAELTTGGQTEFAKDLLEARQRGTKSFGERINKPIHKIEDALEEEPEEDVLETLQMEEEGLTPKEKVARESERFKTGLKPFQEATTKLRGLTRDRHRLDILDNLSKSDKLPKNFGRLNVDSEGNLRLPFAASPESQRYVKTLNEFAENAKDSFGSRVTNFDLQQYFRRFPTLLNSKEGRDQLIKQMKIVNDINSVYYKNLKKVYDRAGGVRKIDADVAESLAEKMSAPQIDKLSKRFDEIGQFSSLPAASEFKGRKIRDKETGEIFISNGEDWIPAE